jgi:hypothetical protein
MILREEYYGSNHKGFSCFDCHSAEFSDFPHPLEIRLEYQWNCIDCHADFDQFQLLTDREGINIIQTHEWLPNQERIWVLQCRGDE